MRSASAQLLLLVVLAASLGAQVSGYSFQTIQDPAPNSWTFAAGINNSGTIVGTYFANFSQANGFIDNAGTFITIDDPNGQYSWLYGISNNGEAVGYYQDLSGGDHGFVYQAGTFTDLPEYPGSQHTFAYGVNISGQIVGTYYDGNSHEHGFLYYNGLFTSIDVQLSGVTVIATYVQGINDESQIVGTYYDSNSNVVPHGFLYYGGKFASIDYPGASGTYAYGINNHGQIVGFYSITGSGNNFGYMEKNGTWVSVDDPQGIYGTSPVGINDAGEIVGGYGGSPGAGFMATPTRSIPVPFVQSLSPASVIPGSPGFTLMVDGSGFTSNSTVNWNGSGRPTSFVSSTQLMATIAASDVVTPQTVQVTVLNKPAAIPSNTALLQVTSPTPSVSMNQTFSYTDSDFHRWLTVGDFNGDGKSDIIVTDQTSESVLVFLGNGNGTFQSPVKSNANFYVASVTVGDFNGDGKLDIAVSDDVSTVAVLLGNGDGSFQSPLVIPESFPSALSIAVGDFNGDGLLDLAVANQSLNSVSVLFGNGDGTFQVASPYLSGTAPSFVAVGDFNGDGVLDLVTANRTSDTISVLIGDSDGTFQPQVEYATSTNPVSVIVADVNADGKADIVVANQSSNTISVLRGNGDGTFQPKIDYAINTIYPYALLSGDFNGDGNVDVITVGNSNVSLLLGNGDASFQAPITVASEPYFSASASDFNGDGRLDLAACYSGSLAVLSQVPAVKLSSTHLTFPTQVVFTSSKAKTVTLSNTGSAILTVSNISTSGPFSATNTCTSVAPGANCTISATFTPTTDGIQTGFVSVVDNAPGSPQTVSLKGTGTYMQLTPKGVNFGSLPVGTKSLPKKITLTNRGGVTVTITGISIVGANGTDFAETNTCGNSLTAGASCTISVTFTPSAKGVRTADVSVRDNGGGSPQGASLTGTGT